MNQEYERNHSHTHCWNRNPVPPCNIPIENHKQCCLCDTPVQSKEEKCICGERKEKHIKYKERNLCPYHGFDLQDFTPEEDDELLNYLDNR